METPVEPEPQEWISSDHHFGHFKNLEYSARPFSTIQEHDDELIRRWNTSVKPRDIVFHLGDLALGDIEATVRRTACLHGHKFLVPGNHDRVFSGRIKPASAERYRALYEDAGWTILPEIFEHRLGRHDVRLSHFPSSGDSHGPDRYDALRPDPAGTPVIHGHVHGEFATLGRGFNVGVDIHDFTPVPASTIVRWLDQLDPQ